MDRIVALAGGVGGAKLAEGLSRSLGPGELTIIVNTGDDFSHFGLHISPDLDTVVYTLAGLADPARGWGRADESWKALETIALLGGPAWFRLGDRDLGLHLERTRRLHEGATLTAITADFCRQLQVDQRVLPMSDDRVATLVHTREGVLAFQEYFVARKCEPAVSGFEFSGLEQARPTGAVLSALEAADLVIICPSNPWVSIDPILALLGVRERLVERTVVAVSPLIGGQAVKGPAAKMFAELGFEPSSRAVAQHYSSILTGLVLDRVDIGDANALAAAGLPVLTAQTWMKSSEDRRRLAAEVLEFGRSLAGRLVV